MGDRRAGRSTSSDGPREVKVVIVGETGVGKSSLLIRFIHNNFRDNPVATIGVSFLSKTITTKGPIPVIKFNVWDTAGQEKYRSIAALYYRGADCALVVYDITDRESFEQAKQYWLQELQHQCGEYGGLQVCIVGNKSDLSSQRAVSEEEGRRVAEHFGAMFFETSAKRDSKIGDIFAAFALELPASDRSLSVTSNAFQVHVPKSKSSCPCV